MSTGLLIDVYRRAIHAQAHRQPSPGVYFLPYPVFEAVRYSGIQLDTARYVLKQLDAVGYSGTQRICCNMDRYI